MSLPAPPSASRPEKSLTDNDITNLEKIAELRGLLGRLRNYARHATNCDCSIWLEDEGADFPMPPCDCGFDALISELNIPAPLVERGGTEK